jgi:23S rRNA (guanosine2251-2'-O)-methyltransferase
MGMAIVVVAHNIRSTYNVGSILRTADGFGVQKVIFTGYSPYPTQPSDARLPHLRDKITKQIHKTALGAEVTMPTEYSELPEPVIAALRADGYHIMALEQSARAIMLADVVVPQNSALLLGEEVHGIEPALLALADTIVEIPMYGAKESFNVSVATGIALYELSKSKR